MFGFRNKLLSVSYIFLFFFHYTFCMLLQYCNTYSHANKACCCQVRLDRSIGSTLPTTFPARDKRTTK